MEFLKKLLEEKGVELDETFFAEAEKSLNERYIQKEKYDEMLIDGKLKTAIARSGAKSEKALWGFIDRESLKLENGELKGIENQLADIKKNYGYLFEETQTNTGFNHQSGMSIDYDSLSDEEYYQLKERN